jgi:hypothetical protein
MKMRLLLLLMSALVLPLCASDACARNTMQLHPIQDVLDMGKANRALGDDIQLYFADQPHPAIEATLSKGVVTNKKTNSVNKSDVEACNWTMLSTLMQLQERARQDGGNAVINIASYYKKKRFESREQYECAAGGFMNGVALTGDVVKLKSASGKPGATPQKKKK